MPTYTLMGFANSTVGWSDGQIEATGPAVVSDSGLTIEVIDDDPIFDDESAGGGETYDTSSQVLGNSFGVVSAGQVIQSVYSWAVTNTTTGEVGTGYLLRIYNSTDPTNPWAGGQDGEYYQVFTIAVNNGDVLSYSPGNFIGQAPYADIYSGNVINGTPDDDFLVGTPGADEINGFAGNDIIRSRGGDDTLNGDDGHDMLIAGDGNDTLNGGNGDDYLRGGEGDDVIDGGAGFDRAAFTVLVNNPSIGETGVQTGATVDLNIQGVAQNTGHGLDTLIGIENVSGTAYADTLTGNGGDNWIWGEGGSDILSGGGGNDLVELGVGNPTVDGGGGTDTLTFFGNDAEVAAGITFDLSLQGAGQATSLGTITATGFENLSGTVFADNLSGDGNDNVIAGDQGDDTLNGGGGNDTLYGDGRIFIDDHGTGLSGAITTFTDVNASFGVADGNDTLDGGAGNDILNGGGGSDTASFASSTEGVIASLANSGNGSAENLSETEFDQLISIENLSGSAFNDQLIGNNSDNVLSGGDGDDLIFGRGGNDTLIGGDGNDFFRNGTGNDVIDGGVGFDRVSSYGSGLTTGVHVDLNLQGIAQDTGHGMDTLTGIEALSGTDFDDTLIGDGNNNWLLAADGNDTLIGNGGNDLLDVLDGELGPASGNHTLDGGTGNDTAGFNGVQIDPDGVTVSLALQGGAQDSGHGLLTLTNIENLSGSLHDDTLAGDSNNNGLYGHSGNDSLSGGGGDDNLYGDGALVADTTASGGGSGPITFFSDVTTLDPSLVDGNDVLEGGAGNDHLDGGGGLDAASYEHNDGRVEVYLQFGFADEYAADGTTLLSSDTLVGIENAIGSNFDDFLSGNNGDNVLVGLEGNDNEIGNAGNDVLYGGGGNDTLRGDQGGNAGPAGNDILIGGGGNDFLNGGYGDDTLDGSEGYDRATFFSGATAGVHVDLNLQGVAQNTGQGMDTLLNIENVSGTAFGDTLIGDNNDNWLWGSPSTDGVNPPTGANNDTLDGGGGNDLLMVGIGNHSLTGGGGTDTVAFTENGSPEPGLTISLALQGVAQATGAGSWTLNGIENLSGGINNDALTGDGTDNVLAGDQGNDTLVGGGGNDTLYGDGRIAIDYAGGPGTSGPIATFADGATADPAFVDGNDTLEGGLGDDTLNGGGGSDTASYAHASGDVQAFLYNGNFGEAFGADGYDQLFNIENLTGSAFNDQLTGNNQANVLSGGDGHDSLRGNAGNDTLLGGNGDDFLNGGIGDDTIDGGAGVDRAAFYTGATAGVTVNLNIVGPQATGQGNDTLIGIENVSGTAFGDTLIGNGGDNWLWGSPATLGDGSISAANNDTLDGGGGNDLLTVGIGNHSLTGGSGIDTVSFTENGNPEPDLTISLALQGVAQVTGAGSWTLNGIENLSGGIGNDSLTGDGGNNVLAGDVGNDSLVGGAGDDTLYGDGRIGTDSHGVGSSGPITTWADATTVDPSVIDGNDTLEGGFGNDTLNGGGGTDTASYAHASGDVVATISAGGGGGASGADGTDTFVSIENLLGSAFNDTLTGDGGANVLDGSGGNDALRGRGGNDTLLGGNGNDFLNGGFGDDTIDGGAGYDRATYFTGATAGVHVDLNLQGVAQDTGQGFDTLTNIENVSGTAFGDTLIGDNNDNWLWGSPSTDGVNPPTGANNDTLDGGGGNDLLMVGIGNHSLTGGTGTDTVAFTENGSPEPGLTISLASPGVAQATGAGTWTLTGIENLSGGINNDALTGDGNANVLAGNTGDDTLVGGGGNDTLYGDGSIAIDYGGGPGTSGPIATFADVTLTDPSLVPGNDTLEGGLGDDTLNGGGGSDTASYAHAGGGVSVDLGAGTASGADGNDTLISIENATGSAFDDTLIGSAGANVLSGGGGNDNIRGLGGNDTLNGEAGHDFMRGGDGNDTVSGGDGDDYLAGDAGDDYLDGGNGFDRVSYAVSATSGVTVSLAITTAQVTGQGTDTIINVENLTGTRFSDSLTGNGGDNWIWGGSDGTGVTGNDNISAGGGSDLVEVGTGNHTLNGGTGNDTLSLFGNSSDITAAGITFDLTLQGAAQNTEQGMMNASGFENVSGSIYADFITGDAGANILLGDVGNDTIRGGDGNDKLYGDGRMLVDDHGTGASGPITLFHDADPTAVGGNDTLLGGKGDDWLYGGRGNDTLTGNQGIDRYVIETNSGSDHVTDFAVGTDKVLFEAVGGIDDFTDLTLTKVGNNTVITWGTGDSLTLDGIKPSQLHAGDFEFSASAAAASTQEFSRAEIGTDSFHAASFGGDAFEQSTILHEVPHII